MSDAPESDPKLQRIVAATIGQPPYSANAARDAANHVAVAARAAGAGFGGTAADMRAASHAADYVGAAAAAAAARVAAALNPPR